MRALKLFAFCTFASSGSSMPTFSRRLYIIYFDTSSTDKGEYYSQLTTDKHVSKEM